VLFLAQLVDNAFFAQRIASEVGDAEDDRRLAHRYLETTAHAAFLTFVIAEAAALYGVCAWTVDADCCARGWRCDLPDV
jgi:hypothetical protein